MAEQSKFSGALAKLNQRAEDLDEQTTDPAPQEAFNGNVATEKAKGGRPPGKRSNPDFEQTTLLLRKETKKYANRALEDTGSKMDLSDLVEQLLTDWTAQNS
jgi:hypothetical protein